jgi:hypothetical protein
VLRDFPSCADIGALIGFVSETAPWPAGDCFMKFTAPTKRGSYAQEHDSSKFHRALFFLASVFAFGGDKAEVKGMITARTGETLIVASGSENVTVVLTDETTTKDDKGLFGLDKQHLSNVVLIPGLKVDVDGTSDEQGRIVAKTITTDGDDLEAAEMIQAGLHPTAEQDAANVQNINTNQQNIGANKAQLAAQKENIETNQQNISANQQQIARNIKDIEENTNRFTALSEYDVKGQATVNFNSGSSKVSAKDQEELRTLAQNARAKRHGPNWLHRRGYWLCRRDRRRCNEHATERGSR